MVRLANVFSQFRSISALLVGDFLLDKDTIGGVSRISPEAPVAVLNVEKQKIRPGGAGNVALNLCALGAKVFAVGRRGEDEEGKEMLSLLRKEGIDVSFFVVQKNYPTPVKNRLLAAGQHILRIDTEKIDILSQDLEEIVKQNVRKAMQQVDVVVISDYGKGMLSDGLLHSIIEEGRKRRTCVLVDPKGKNFSKYKGATMIKPNQAEAYLAAHLSKTEPLEKVAEKLLQETQTEILMITRSEEGIVLFDQRRRRYDFPVKSRAVKDVTGAGDTVLATVAMALANDVELSIAIELANIAAGLAIEQVGCATVSLSELATRMLFLDSKNKVFQESHLFALKHMLQGKKFAILALSSKEGFSTSLFEKILLCSREGHLLLYLKDDKPPHSFIQLLSSLKEIDFIVLHQESLKNLCLEIHPDRVIEMQGKEAIIHQDPKELFQSLLSQKIK